MKASCQGNKMFFRNLFAIFLLILLFFILAGCQTPSRVYLTPIKACTWNTVEELIVCKGPPTTKGESIE